VDLQAVESIPRDTLVALLRRKDKEAKGHAAKLDKLEERYVKVVRFNKILMEDRTSFQRFCNELLPESDGIFEEAAAQESPVNLDALLRRLTAWRSAFEAANEDRKVFQQFIELVFPGDEVVAQLFAGPGLGSEAFDTLQHRWVAHEDLHNQSIASINGMAREQMMSRAKEFEAAVAARQEADRRCEELREQLTQLAREKAQMLTQKLQSGGSGEADGGAPKGNGAVPPPPPPPAAAVASPSPTSVGGSAEVLRLHDELRELRQAREAAERRTREALGACEGAERREQELSSALEECRSEVRQLKREAERLAEESGRHRGGARQLLEEKDALVDRLQTRIAELEQEISSNAFISHYAEQQAGREREIKAQQRQVEQLNQTLTESQRLLSMNYSQERVLKERIRELEMSHGRGHVAGDYLKHVVLKYIQYNQVGDLKAQSLVPVLCTLLSFTSEERGQVEQTAIPQPLLLINQAVGGATTWLRGSGESSAPLPSDLGDGGAGAGG